MRKPRRATLLLSQFLLWGLALALLLAAAIVEAAQTGPILPDPHGGLVLLAGHGLSPDPACPPGRLGSCGNGGEQHGAVHHQRLRPGSGRQLRLLGRRRPQPDPAQVRRRHGQRGNPGQRRHQLSLPHRGGQFLRLLGRQRHPVHQAGPDLRVPHRHHHRRLIGRGVQRRRHRAGRQLSLLGGRRQRLRPGGGHLQPQHRHHAGQRRSQQSLRTSRWAATAATCTCWTATAPTAP